MKAMIINAYGGSDVFEHAEIDKPEVSAGHVLVKVSATSVNTVDTMIRQMGQELPLSPPLPAVLGMDFAGTIEEIGADVNGFKVGDEIYGCAGGLANLQGALAEYMLADAKLVALKPKSISMREAAALPLVGITAYEGLVRAGVGENQKVLVHGGSGGVGHVALQLANYLGADVYSTGGGDAQLSLIESLGATGINYRSQPVSNLHVIFMLIPMLHDYKREQHGDILSKLATIVDEGKLKLKVDSEHFDLSEVAKAHDRLESGKAMGKVVVSV